MLVNVDEKLIKDIQKIHLKC